MAFKDKVQTLLDEAFDEYKSLFLIDFTISSDNKIRVIMDGDNGVTLDDCIKVSRHIEHNLDREEEDFSLEVMSPGATEPIKHNRQYAKNVGRKLEVKTLENEKFEGTLVNVAEEGVKLEWKAREPKPVGKGKITVVKEKEIPFSDIVEARVKVIF
ncbi:ribosome assembly cofactor RimP [Leptobacterium flavescens]|uniref:Ribosome maturation factor RimP n=1 Tax=Leptobacterium flavescens TaxID=472055 RepID=A0A6P0ULC4_9FLAO|nr:ribosome assembly cofactor RimP [Leptobacterium flavescens]NER12689.1 ribosome assembly cofactor RimP [Leptobacterium flavescens]